MSKYYCKECGEWPLKARGMCQRCYDRWYAQQPHRKAKAKAWRDAHPDYFKNWRKENREHVNAYHNKYYHTHFGGEA